jgi:hypothetical protein
MPDTDDQPLKTTSVDTFFRSADNSLAGNKPPDNDDNQQQQGIDPPRASKQTPGESAKVLKQNLENLKKEKEKLEQKIQELSSANELTPLKPVADYIKTKFGKEKLDEDAVNQFIEKNKTRKQKALELEDALKKKDQYVKDIEITLSDEWRNEYQKPWADAENSLLATLCPVDDEGQPKNVELVNSLKTELISLKDGKVKYLNADGTINALAVKGALQKFSRLYEEKTQETYRVPDIEKINNGIKSIVSCAIKANQAKANWEEDRKKHKIKSEYESSEARKEMERKEIEGRKFLTNKVIKEFDAKSLDGVLTEEEIKNAFESENNKFIKYLKGEEQPPTYDNMVLLSFKASQYDKVLTKLRAVEKELETERKKRGSGLPSNSTTPRTPKPPKEGESEKKESVSDFFSNAHQRVAS